MSETGIISKKQNKPCNKCKYQSRPNFLKRLVFGSSFDACTCWVHNPEERRKILQDGKAVGYYCDDRNPNDDCKEYKRR